MKTGNQFSVKHSAKHLPILGALTLILSSNSFAFNAEVESKARWFLADHFEASNIVSLYDLQSQKYSQYSLKSEDLRKAAYDDAAKKIASFKDAEEVLSVFQDAFSFVYNGDRHDHVIRHYTLENVDPKLVAEYPESFKLDDKREYSYKIDPLAFASAFAFRQNGRQAFETYKMNFGKFEEIDQKLAKIAGYTNHSNYGPSDRNAELFMYGVMSCTPLAPFGLAGLAKVGVKSLVNHCKQPKLMKARASLRDSMDHIFRSGSEAAKKINFDSGEELELIPVPAI